ncbi:hypothetical protein C6500_05585 [Candidatus Poribacteria bacterium]|nr:MAG: hypothetical protein C6500_05585 [Candidatus Poribacteria bacterium]
MKVLVRCQFYLMILFVAVLFTVVTVAGDDQTKLSTEDVTQMTKKPTIMILGGPHLANPGMDTFNDKMDDVLSPKRQREIQEVVKQLKAFKPTKIALEVDSKRDTEVNAKYQGYLDGTYKLKRGEGDQIGFRLAKEMGHSRVYCVDHFRDAHMIRKDRDPRLTDRRAFAKAHNQEYLLYTPPVIDGKITQDAEGKTWIESEKYESILDMYIQHNLPEWNNLNHQAYLRQARVGLDDEYPGANWLAYFWYPRNLKIFVNLTRITESADDRILLIIGAGHVFLVQQFLEDSGDYIVESPLKYLDNEGM